MNQGWDLLLLLSQDIFEKIDLINKQDNVTVFLVEQNARMALKASTDGLCHGKWTNSPS